MQLIVCFEELYALNILETGSSQIGILQEMLYEGRDY